jgi:hypothetical protein
MGKKSRRKAPRDVKAKATPQALGIREAKPPTAQVPGRFPPLAHFGLEMGTAENLLRQLYVVEAESDPDQSPEGDWADVDEFLSLVVYPQYRKGGLERALRAVRRWLRLRPHWRRVRRRICDFCAKQNDLSEPRLEVCSGCGVARYCNEECQSVAFK